MNRGRRICIVGSGNLAWNPRLLKEAEALHEAGYDVTTVACDYTKELKDLDDEVAARVPWKVVRVPRPAGERGIAVVAGWLARLVAATGAAVSPGLAARACGGPISSLRRAASAVSADLYIAHYTASLAAVAPVARRRGVLLGFDAEDFHSGEGAGGAGDDFRMKMVATMERGILPSCAYVTAAAPLISRAYAARYGVTPVTLLNVFPLDMAPAAPAADPAPGAPAQLRAYWFSQTIGLDRGLQALIQAMARTKCHVTLDIRGGNKRGDGDRLVELARALGIAGRVAILPPAPPDSMVTLAAEYDVGLSLETDINENRGICLTNKTFTYLLAGIPTVMSDTPGQRAFAPDLGAAAVLVSLSDAAAIAAVLDRLAGTPADLAQAKRTAWRLGRERYNWDVEKKILIKTVDLAFAARGGASGRAH